MHKKLMECLLRDKVEGMYLKVHGLKIKYNFT